jgi:type IV pilus assembly protein PilB
MAYPQEHIATIPIPATKRYYLEMLKRSDLWYSKSMKDEKIPTKLLDYLPRDIIEQYQIMPVDMEVQKEDGTLSERLVLVTDWVQNLKEISLFEEMAGMPVKIKISDNENVKQGILFHYNVKTKLMDIANLENEEEEQRGVDQEYDATVNSLIVTKLENIIHTALNKGGSDIHLHPGDKQTYVKIRIDGRLVNFSKEYPIDESEKNYIVNIVKNMCRPALNTSNHLMPDDGSFRRKWNQKWIDFRVSTMPTILGQEVVIRLLDSTKVPLNMDQLGFSEKDKTKIKKIIMIPAGLFFVTGPTGSGKSTTIHAAMEPFKRMDHKCITIENPCEYRDENLAQIQIREGGEKVSLDGRKIFKAILRQDPETIFYGETRDKEDASLLITATLSGHRILSTLHATDAVSGLDRLFDLGVEKSSLKQINGILSQRLLTLNCPHCSEAYTPSEEETLLLTDLEIADLQSGAPKQGKGCASCNEGFLGRKVVTEIIVFTNEFRDFLLEKEHGIIEIQKYLREKQDFKTIWENGLELVKAGQVKLSELIRVFPPSL